MLHPALFFWNASASGDFSTNSEKDLELLIFLCYLCAVLIVLSPWDGTAQRPER